jgi:hypothetical protein
LSEQNTSANGTDQCAEPIASDITAGAAIGVFLGLLIGLSGSPIVSGVATGLVALLAGIFGVSEKLAVNFSYAAKCRLIAFAVSAIISVLAAMYVRTHDLLAPSISSQKAVLGEMGITDKKDQTEMLRFIKYGILPVGTVAPAKDSSADAFAHQRLTVLHAQSAQFCRSLLIALSGSQEDFLKFLDENDLKETAAILRRLPEPERKPAIAASRVYLCKV